MISKIVIFLLGIIFGMVLMCFIAYKWATEAKNDKTK